MSDFFHHRHRAGAAPVPVEPAVGVLGDRSGRLAQLLQVVRSTGKVDSALIPMLASAADHRPVVDAAGEPVQRGPMLAPRMLAASASDSAASCPDGVDAEPVQLLLRRPA